MRLRSLMYAVVVLIATGCARSPQSSGARTDDTTRGMATDTTTHAVVLVKALPAGIEGLELSERGVRVKKGYQFVKDTDSTFMIMRLSDRHGIKVGGCGCKVGAGCIPVITDDGIIVCATILCDPCGLALTSNGVRTEIVRYEKR